MCHSPILGLEEFSLCLTQINELFKRYIPKPVMVIVDVRPGVVGIPTSAYFAVEEIKDV